MKTFWLVTLCFFISGCSAYRDAYIPATVPHIESRPKGLTVVEGSNVRVTLHSGQTVSGKVSRLTSEKLGLGSRGNYGHEDLVIELTDIQQIEIKNQSDAEVERLWFFGIGALLIGLIVHGLSNIGMS